MIISKHMWKALEMIVNKDLGRPDVPMFITSADALIRRGIVTWSESRHWRLTLYGHKVWEKRLTSPEWRSTLYGRREERRNAKRRKTA